jgi:voltage-gated potassium channel
MSKNPSKFKKKIFEVLYTNDSDKSNAGIWYLLDDYFISGLILLNVAAIMLQSFDPVYQNYKTLFFIFEVFSVVVFSLEYIFRIWVVDLKYPKEPAWKAKLGYIFSFMGLVDLLAILPFYLPFLIKIDLRFLRILRLLRLFRIFKLAHYSESIRLVGAVIKDKKDELGITLFGTFILLLVTSTLMYEIENPYQPEQFPNIFASFWWAVATLTTIGYGDVYPITAWGKFLAGLTAIFGIGLVAIPTGLISVGFMEEIDKKNKKKKQQPDIERSECGCPNYCPNCGEDLKQYKKE